MSDIDISQFYYFPCLQCSEQEQIAYAELSEDDKDAILPIIELSQIKSEASFDQSIAAVQKMVGNRPFILDLAKDRAPPAYVPKNNPDHARIAKSQAAQDEYNASVASALIATDGFANWRRVAKMFPAAIPILQFTDPESQGKSILRQAVQLLKDGAAKIAVRVNQETNEALFPVIGQVAAICETAADVVVIVDCGQGRQRVAERAEFARLAISRILEELEPGQAMALSAVCINDSYTNPPNVTLKLYESCSWQIWAQASEKFPFQYGDYGSHYRIKKTNTYVPSDWRARVVFPMDESWLVYRHPNSQDTMGWVLGSRAVINDGNCDHGNECWGSDLVERAATGDINGVATARYWHAAKINMHIHRQIRYARQVMTGGGDV